MAPFMAAEATTDISSTAYETTLSYAHSTVATTAWSNSSDQSPISTTPSATSMPEKLTTLTADERSSTPIAGIWMNGSSSTVTGATPTHEASGSSASEYLDASRTTSPNTTVMTERPNIALIASGAMAVFLLTAFIMTLIILFKTRAELAKRNEQSFSNEEQSDNDSSHGTAYDVVQGSNKPEDKDTYDTMGQWRGGKADDGDNHFDVTPRKIASTESEHETSRPSHLKSSELVSCSADKQEYRDLSHPARHASPYEEVTDVLEATKRDKGVRVSYRVPQRKSEPCWPAAGCHKPHRLSDLIPYQHGEHQTTAFTRLSDAMSIQALQNGQSNSDKTSRLGTTCEDVSEATNIAKALKKISDANPNLATLSASEQPRISHLKQEKPDTETTADGVYNHLNEVEKSPRRRFEGAVFCLPEIPGDFGSDQKPKQSLTRFRMAGNEEEGEYSRLQS